jgi:serine/threonine-protein kinase haspin
MFPFDPIVWESRSVGRERSKFRKIGEASYSEVFGIGDVVLKVIPLRDEGTVNVKGRTPTQTAIGKPKPKYGERNEIQVLVEEGPPPSDAKDVLKEVIVTRAMGDMCEGFVKLLRTYVVRGRYPEVLLDLWDEYYEKKGSESIRPGKRFLVLSPT